MASILDSVNQRTQLVGQNRLELLLFRMTTKQQYGINVFKVREVLQCPNLTELPNRHPVVRGVAHIRGQTISIIDMSMAIGGPALTELEKCFIIIAEYNSSVQGFLVSSVERIVNMNWEHIHPPPKGSGKNSYLTAVTEVEKQLVEIIDVEKILSEITPLTNVVSASVIEESLSARAPDFIVLIADDSAVARNQVTRTLDQVKVQVEACKDGAEALRLLKLWADQNSEKLQKLLMVISDIEMPEMDGYTLTSSIRNDPRLQNLYVMLHTSLSGVFNNAMIEKVGANAFIPKFQPDDLANTVQERLRIRIREEIQG